MGKTSRPFPTGHFRLNPKKNASDDTPLVIQLEYVVKGRPIRRSTGYTVKPTDWDRSTESSFRGLLGKRRHSTERLTINVYRLSLACATALDFARCRHGKRSARFRPAWLIAADIDTSKQLVQSTTVSGYSSQATKNNWLSCLKTSTSVQSIRLCNKRTTHCKQSPTSVARIPTHNRRYFSASHGDSIKNTCTFETMTGAKAMRGTGSKKREIGQNADSGSDWVVNLRNPAP